MHYYNKISAIFKRKTGKSHEVDMWNFADPAVEYAQSLIWEWTEKVDGTSIAVHWDGNDVEIFGHTDKSQIPEHLKAFLDKKFRNHEMHEVFEQKFGAKDVWLYGEGYGKKIGNNGARYIKDGVNFILFDVTVDGIFFSRDQVGDVGEDLGIDVVPIVGTGSLSDAVSYVSRAPKSVVAEDKTLEMEGVVARTAVELFNKVGGRLITKIKLTDFE